LVAAEPGATITVLLADDHPLVRRGFRRILEDDSGVTVVGEASDGDEAVRLAKSIRPQVVLIDYAMPGMNGVAATRAILRDAPDTKVVVLSMHSEDTLVRHAIEAGARGYVLKSAIDLDLAAVVRRAAAGEVVLDPRLAPGEALKGDRQSVLTPREMQVLQLICDGQSNREIAASLDLSVNTVAVHRANIMNALGIHKTAELVVYAIRNGLVHLQ
jgi:DNA-binding NarL/FixJ family response regulator